MEPGPGPSRTSPEVPARRNPALMQTLGGWGEDSRPSVVDTDSFQAARSVLGAMVSSDGAGADGSSDSRRAISHRARLAEVARPAAHLRA